MAWTKAMYTSRETTTGEDGVVANGAAMGRTVTDIVTRGQRRSYNTGKCPRKRHGAEARTSSIS